MKVALSAKFRCLHRSHALCFRRSLANIQLFSTNYNIYMRELIAAGGRRDSSGHQTTGFSQKYIENAF